MQGSVGVLPVWHLRWYIIDFIIWSFSYPGVMMRQYQKRCCLFFDSNKNAEVWYINPAALWPSFDYHLFTGTVRHCNENHYRKATCLNWPKLAKLMKNLNIPLWQLHECFKWQPWVCITVQKWPTWHGRHSDLLHGAWSHDIVVTFVKNVEETMLS